MHIFIGFFLVFILFFFNPFYFFWILLTGLELHLTGNLDLRFHLIGHQLCTKTHMEQIILPFKSLQCINLEENAAFSDPGILSQSLQKKKSRFLKNYWKNVLIRLQNFWKLISMEWQLNHIWRFHLPGLTRIPVQKSLVLSKLVTNLKSLTL